MKPEKFNKWKETRKKGRWKYALKYGSLWGVLMTLFIYFMNPVLHIFSGEMTPVKILILFLVYWFVGVSIYLLLWYQNEKAFKYYLEHEENKDF